MDWSDYEVDGQLSIFDLTMEDSEEFINIVIPVKYGTTVYVIPTIENGLKDIVEMVCLGYSLSEPVDVANLFSKNRFNKDCPKMYQPSIDDYGKIWFKSKSKAVEQLRKLETR